MFPTTNTIVCANTLMTSAVYRIITMYREDQLILRSCLCAACPCPGWEVYDVSVACMCIDSCVIVLHGQVGSVVCVMYVLCAS